METECDLCDKKAEWERCLFVVECYDGHNGYGTTLVNYDLCNECLNRCINDEDKTHMGTPRKITGGK